MGSCGAEPPAGGRRRRTKKHHRRRHRTRRGGYADASFNGVIQGPGGAPAGAAFTAIGVSRAGPGYEASSYDQKGGRRSRRRRHRSRRSRHRMRGGDASEMGGLGKGGVSASFTGGEPTTTNSGSTLMLRGFAEGSTRVQ